MDEFIEIRHFGKIAILDGGEGLGETEHCLYRYLVAKHYEVLVITDLFNHPEKIQALKLLNIDTIVVGTTGTFASKLTACFAEFDKLKWLPKNAIFTMGEDYFKKFIEAGVKGYMIYPMSEYHKDEKALITEL